ncbi:MAG: ABC transporter ATP-binding protein [Bacteroidales bacterium]|nr:ABC transporter ATP-binding protein [Bacteroides sp.]MCM1198770.1 ABC transporter ATP-binding protein [Clostridium sp.]MCM1503025.1 ABC transporter ATP-binding protein [Bacteroidales bacterium]
MIKFDRLTIGYRDNILVKGAEIEIGHARLVAMVGCNGSGKSTLIKAMAGITVPFGGRIMYDGCDIRSFSAEKKAQMVAIVSTERVRIPGFSCMEVVSMGRSPYTGWTGSLSVHDRGVVCRSLDVVGMAGFAERSMDTMSDGECQKIMVARALAQETPVILLDEPTAFLDYPGRRMISSLLGNIAHADGGKTVIYSTHDIDLALEFSDDIMIVAPPCLHYGPASDSALRQRMWNEFTK